MASGCGTSRAPTPSRGRGGCSSPGGLGRPPRRRRGQPVGRPHHEGLEGDAWDRRPWPCLLPSVHSSIRLQGFLEGLRRRDEGTTRDPAAISRRSGGSTLGSTPSRPLHVKEEDVHRGRRDPGSPGSGRPRHRIRRTFRARGSRRLGEARPRRVEPRHQGGHLGPGLRSSKPTRSTIRPARSTRRTPRPRGSAGSRQRSWGPPGAHDASRRPPPFPAPSGRTRARSSGRGIRRS
jgi:hypothetical protein